jgi:hypothetical protein
MDVFSALIKNRHFWPIVIPGQTIHQHCASNLELGECKAVQGKLQNVDYFFLGMKDPGYTMKIMVTGGTLFADETCLRMKHEWDDKSKKFQFTLPFDWHFFIMQLMTINICATSLHRLMTSRTHNFGFLCVGFSLSTL